jgi:hypothetical protein
MSAGVSEMRFARTVWLTVLQCVVATTLCAENVRVTANVLDVDLVHPSATAYEVFRPIEEITIALGVKNEGREPILLNMGTLADTTVVSVSSAERVPVVIEWDKSFKHSGHADALPLNDRSEVVLRPGDGLECGLVIRRSKKAAFTRGRYAIDLQIEPHESVRTFDGDRLPTRTPESRIQLSLDIRKPVGRSLRQR